MSVPVDTSTGSFVQFREIFNSTRFGVKFFNVQLSNPLSI